MKLSLSSIVIVSISTPTYVLGMLFVGIALLTGFATNPRVESPNLLVVTWREWWARKWKYSTTIGRGVAFHPNHLLESGEPNSRLYGHEMVHVRQAEDNCAHSWFVGALIAFSTGNINLALVVWMVLPPLAMLLNMMMAGLRHGWENAYRHSEHERAAYSQNPRD